MFWVGVSFRKATAEGFCLSFIDDKRTWKSRCCTYLCCNKKRRLKLFVQLWNQLSCWNPRDNCCWYLLQTLFWSDLLCDGVFLNPAAQRKLVCKSFTCAEFCIGFIWNARESLLWDKTQLKQLEMHTSLAGIYRFCPERWDASKCASLWLAHLPIWKLSGSESCALACLLRVLVW